MSSVGETLRRERLRAGLDLENISRDTKISVRMLELIEGDRFEKLPGGVFARSFVRQYARAVGLDEEEIVGELEKALAPKPAPLPAAPEVDTQPEIRLPRLGQWVDAGRRRSSSLPALALVVLMMLVCSLAYTWWQKSRHVPAISAGSTDTAPATKAPAPAAAHANIETRAAVTPAPPVSSAITLDSAAGTVRIALTAEEATWVKATANGKVVFSGIIQPNETKALSAADTVTLRLGNAGGVSISLNGKAIPSVGPRGQVRIVQLSPDGGVQVVPSAPPAKPQPSQPSTQRTIRSLQQMQSL